MGCWREQESDKVLRSRAKHPEWMRLARQREKEREHVDWNDENRKKTAHKLNFINWMLNPVVRVPLKYMSKIRYKSGICRTAEKLHFLSVFFGSRRWIARSFARSQNFVCRVCQFGRILIYSEYDCCSDSNTVNNSYHTKCMHVLPVAFIPSACQILGGIFWWKTSRIRHSSMNFNVIANRIFAFS